MNWNQDSEPIENVDAAYPGKFYKAADLEDGPMHLTIAGFGFESVRSQGGEEQKPVLRFKGEDRGIVLNITNKDALKKSFGRHASGWIGKQIELYRTETQFAGSSVPCIRVRVPA